LAVMDSIRLKINSGLPISRADAATLYLEADDLLLASLATKVRSRYHKHDEATYLYGKSCLSNCPTGWAPSVEGAFSFADIYCVKPFPTKGRGVGFPQQGTCTSKAGPDGCENCLGLWYAKCPMGYKAAGCNLGTQLCPEGTIDRGNNCERAIVVPAKTFC
jgi:hypothetical protein